MNKLIKKPIIHIQQCWDFSTDGCSNSPDFNFKDCCKTHDFHYRNFDITRFEADKELLKCIKKKGWKVLPYVYYYAVRLFGWMSWNKNKNKK